MIVKFLIDNILVGSGNEEGSGNGGDCLNNDDEDCQEPCKYITPLKTARISD